MVQYRWLTAVPSQKYLKLPYGWNNNEFSIHFRRCDLAGIDWLIWTTHCCHLIVLSDCAEWLTLYHLFISLLSLIDLIHCSGCFHDSYRKLADASSDSQRTEHILCYNKVWTFSCWAACSESVIIAQQMARLQFPDHWFQLLTGS